MKKSVALALSLCAIACLSACNSSGNDSTGSGGICENIPDNTKICYENIVVTCSEDKIVSQEPCTGTCNNGACETRVACNFAGAFCGSDGTTVMTCEGGFEKTTPCTCGCENGSCKTCTTCDCATGANCTEAEKAACNQQPACDCATGANCTEAEKAACNQQPTCDCATGANCTEAEKAACNQQPTCDCTTGANCTEAEKAACNQKPACDCATGANCSEAEKAACNQQKTCDCATGANCTNEEKKACKAAYCVDFDKFEYEHGELGCITETRIATCINGNWEQGKDCKSLGGVCFIGECVDDDGNPICEYSGYACRDNTVVECKKGVEERVENCILGCTAGACDKVSCDMLKRPECADNWSKLVCKGDEVVRERCGDGLLCVEGECVKQNSSAKCTFTTECSADGRSIRKCNEGTVVVEDCPNREYCDDSEGTPACVSAMDEGRCTVNFNDYCDGDMLYSCDFNSAALETGSLISTNCGKDRCVNHQCVSGSNKQIGDDCTVENFAPTCIGEVVVKCDESKKKVVKVDDCAADGLICGTVMVDSIQSAECFEKCSVKGEHRDSCIVTEDNTYEAKHECIEIGNGRYGYSMVPNTWQMCDIGCMEGKCFDYTQGIENAGEKCDYKAFQGYCKDDARAVNCESNGDGEDVVTVEKCFFYESCKVTKNSSGINVSSCASACKPTDPAKYECVPGTGVFAAYHLSYKICLF